MTLKRTLIGALVALVLVPAAQSASSSYSHAYQAASKCLKSHGATFVAPKLRMEYGREFVVGGTVDFGKSGGTHTYRKDGKIITITMPGTLKTLYWLYDGANRPEIFRDRGVTVSPKLVSIVGSCVVKGL